MKKILVCTVRPNEGTGQAFSPLRSNFDWLDARNREGI